MVAPRFSAIFLPISSGFTTQRPRSDFPSHLSRGGLYIDGFAAPQSREHPEAWTARRVLEIRPARLRTFWLCDLDPAGCDQLRDLKSRHNGDPKVRKVFVMQGDFNETVDVILSAGRIYKRTAVFALLDQRNTECHWVTVRKLAAFKSPTKIEMLYFLGIGWLLRSLKTSKSPDIEKRRAGLDPHLRLWVVTDEANADLAGRSFYFEPDGRVGAFSLHFTKAVQARMIESLRARKLKSVNRR